jgi:hypothetical protein
MPRPSCFYRAQRQNLNEMCGKKTTLSGGPYIPDRRQSSWNLGASRSMSPMRGDVKEFFFVRPLGEEMGVPICIQPDPRSGEALCSRHASDRPRHSAVSARRFHDSMVRRLRCEATQANRGGSNTPTMVLFEARGLWLFSVMGGGIECIWRLCADSTWSGLTHRLILSLDPERRKNRLANHQVRQPSQLPGFRRRSSCLRFEMFGVETSSFFPKC